MYYMMLSLDLLTYFLFDGMGLARTAHGGDVVSIKHTAIVVVVVTSNTRPYGGRERTRGQMGNRRETSVSLRTNAVTHTVKCY